MKENPREKKCLQHNGFFYFWTPEDILLVIISNLLCKCSLGWSIFWTLALFLFQSCNFLLGEKCELAQQGPNNSIRDADKKLVEIEDRRFGLI